VDHKHLDFVGAVNFVGEICPKKVFSLLIIIYYVFYKMIFKHTALCKKPGKRKSRAPEKKKSVCVFLNNIEPTIKKPKEGSQGYNYIHIGKVNTEVPVQNKLS